MHSTGGAVLDANYPPKLTVGQRPLGGGKGNWKGGSGRGKWGGGLGGAGGGASGKVGWGGGGPGGAIWGVGGGGGHRLLLPLITKRSLPNSTAALLQPAVGQGIVLSHSQPLVQAVPPW